MAANTNIGSISEILATRTKMNYRYRINFSSIALENVEQMKQWCHENCKESWHSHTTFALYWQFDSEKDATMFMLRWGTARGNQLR